MSVKTQLFTPYPTHTVVIYQSLPSSGPLLKVFPAVEPVTQPATALSAILVIPAELLISNHNLGDLAVTSLVLNKCFSLPICQMSCL